jgi:hypothetical protein
MLALRYRLPYLSPSTSLGPLKSPLPYPQAESYSYCNLSYLPIPRRRRVTREPLEPCEIVARSAEMDTGLVNF